MNAKLLIKPAVILVSVGAGSTYFLLNTKFMNGYKKAVQLYRSGFPQPISPYLRRLSKEVFEDVQLPESLKYKVKLFHVFGDDIYSFGCFSYSDNVFIGLPFNYVYRNAEEMDVDKVEVFQNKIRWNTHSGQKLKDSMCLSDNAKKFAIARELFFNDTYRIPLKSILISLNLLLPHLLYFALNRYTKLKRRRVFVKLLTYYASLGVGYVCYGLSVDSLTHHYEMLADQKTIAIGKSEYFEGAIEYYEKRLQMNKAIRRMMGEYGSNYFTSDGNEFHYFRRFHVPLTKRLAIIEETKYGQMNVDEVS